MKPLIPALNEWIQAEANRLGRPWRAADTAPHSIEELYSAAQGSTIVVWSGASDATIFGDARVNHAFRALHDNLHLRTGLGFGVANEIELGRIQAGMIEARLGRAAADLVFIEVAGQARFFGESGAFPADQLSFAVSAMRRLGYKIS